MYINEFEKILQVIYKKKWIQSTLILLQWIKKNKVNSSRLYYFTIVFVDLFCKCRQWHKSVQWNIIIYIVQKCYQYNQKLFCKQLQSWFQLPCSAHAIVRCTSVRSRVGCDSVCAADSGKSQYRQNVWQC